MHPTSALSIHRAFAGRHILLTDASGFVGKVWLARILHRVPTVDKIYVLLRKKALRPALDRFEKIVARMGRQQSVLGSPCHVPEHGALRLQCDAPSADTAAVECCAVCAVGGNSIRL